MKPSVYKPTHRVPYLVFFVFLIVSCATLPRSETDTIVFADIPPSSPLEIGNVSVEYSKESISPEYPLEEVIETLGRKYKLHMRRGGVGEGRKSGPFTVTVRIKEREFTRNLTLLYSLSVIMTIQDRQTGKELLKIIHNEESGETVESFYRMYKICDLIVRKTAHVITSGA